MLCLEEVVQTVKYDFVHGSQLVAPTCARRHPDDPSRLFLSIWQYLSTTLHGDVTVLKMIILIM